MGEFGKVKLRSSRVDALFGGEDRAFGLVLRRPCRFDAGTQFAAVQNDQRLTSSDAIALVDRYRADIAENSRGHDN